MNTHRRARTATQLAAAVLMPIISVAAAAADYNGADLYMLNCSNCHGVYGEGDGTVTPDLAVVMLDLRYLSERNGGVFPLEFVREIIDGRETRAAHGPVGMPVWGAEFARGEGLDTAAEARVQAKIDALVSYLEGMQLTH
jgi:mono/diheme cytochrome c family protein